MRISWKNLFWKLLTFLILEIDAFSLTIFLEITQVNFLKKSTYPVNVFHV